MNPDAADLANPLHITRTKEQIDESFRESYWQYAIRYGLQYYVSGRFATAQRFTPVCANLLHHAVELLLKAFLSRDDSRETIEMYRYGHSSGGYNHDIRLLWAEFKKRQTAPVEGEFDGVISALHDFQEIRYPETLILNGATISINPFVEQPIDPNAKRPQRSYSLSLPPIDRLVGMLFEASHPNPAFFLDEITDESGIGGLYYEKIKATLFGRAAQ